jgi:hypothetical protein
MKRGDLVRFTRQHSSRPGFEYCADWTGVVRRNRNGTVEILWTDPGNGYFVASYGEYTTARRGLEVISESR